MVVCLWVDLFVVLGLWYLGSRVCLLIDFCLCLTFGVGCDLDVLGSCLILYLCLVDWFAYCFVFALLTWLV